MATATEAIRFVPACCAGAALRGRRVCSEPLLLPTTCSGVWRRLRRGWVIKVGGGECLRGARWRSGSVRSAEASQRPDQTRGGSCVGCAALDKETGKAHCALVAPSGAREGRRRRTFASMDRSPLRRVGSIGISRPAGQHGPPAPCRRVLCRGRVRVSEAVQWGREGRLAEGGGGPRDWSGGPVVSGNAGDSRERAAGRRAKRGAVGCGCSRREEGTAQHAPPRRSLCAR